MAALVLLLTVSSGSFFCCARTGKRYEEILPLTCMGIVLILFLFGLLGLLKLGVYAVLALAAALYAGGGYFIWRHKRKEAGGAFLAGMLTPGSVLFVCMFLAFWLLNQGRLASEWDEFSHWMDTAKILTTLDDFGTNPAAFASFPSYPPGMSLFQYFFQKIYLLFHPQAVFNEGLAFAAFQVLFFSVLFPFFKELSFRQPLRLMLTCGVVFLFPLLFFQNIYASVQIDSFLGVLSGAGLAAAFLERKWDWSGSLYVWMLCAVLVLAKASGLLFAVVLAAAYAVSLLWRDSREPAPRKRGRNLLLCGGAALSVALPKLLWTYEVKSAGARMSFTGKVDLARLWQVLMGRDGSYLATVLENWKNAWGSSAIAFGHTGLEGSVSYLMLVVLLTLACLLLWISYVSHAPKRERERERERIPRPAAGVCAGADPGLRIWPVRDVHVQVQRV